ncbi:MAG: LSU ribosomal protein L7p/L12p (P1/P2), partial [uncultured Rubrobacteraceae bacterium]
GCKPGRVDGDNREHDRSRALGACVEAGGALRRLRHRGRRGPRWWRHRTSARRRGADRVRRRAHGCGGEEDPGHQGRARRDRSGPQGGQGPRRRGPEPRQGGDLQGGRRGPQDPDRRGRRLRGAQV